MTPLFPPPGEPLVIRQGEVGDCYLLSTFDCIYNMPEGQRILRSRFRETGNGVEVRIKRNLHSSQLRTEKLREKYAFYFDTDHNEDVFFLNQERLAAIDYAGAVCTNSLALKILERLSTYYLTGQDDSLKYEDSTMLDLHNPRGDSSTRQTHEFVAELLGFNHNDFSIDVAIKFLTFSRSFPIYVAMFYGTPDAYGKIHSAHALRIQQIIADGKGGYDFILINPWDNKKTETINLTELEKRCASLIYFTPNEWMDNLVNRLLQLPPEQVSLAFEQENLFDSLVAALKLRPSLSFGTIMDWYQLSFNDVHIINFIELYRQIPQFISPFKLLTVEQQKKMLKLIMSAKDNKELFLESLLKDSSLMDVSLKIIDSFVHEFNGLETIEQIDQKEKYIKEQIQWIRSTYERITAEYIFGAPDTVYTQALGYKEQEITTKAKTIRAKIKRLDEIGFSTHLQAIASMKQRLENEAVTNFDYLYPAEVAKQLSMRLKTAKNEFLTDRISAQQFQAKSLDAINEALPILEKHRGWTQVLLDLVNIIISLSTFFIINIATNRLRLFSASTDSAKTVYQMRDVVVDKFAENLSFN
jgi:hypothetical protein